MRLFLGFCALTLALACQPNHERCRDLWEECKDFCEITGSVIPNPVCKVKLPTLIPYFYQEVECRCDEFPSRCQPTVEEIETCECGQPNRPFVRIINGTETYAWEYPWHVGIKKKDGDRHPFCGGSIISNGWILSAGHCFIDENDPDLYLVTIADHDLTLLDPYEEDLDVKEIIIHPELGSDGRAYDFALLNVPGFRPKPTARPICLPKDDCADYTGMAATATGWGTTQWPPGPSVDVQRHVQIDIHDNEYCKERYGGSFDEASMICASRPGKDSCRGDSGGALFIEDEAGFTAVGVVSWGMRCGDIDSPGVYSRVTAALSWIKEVIGNKGLCSKESNV